MSHPQNQGVPSVQRGALEVPRFAVAPTYDSQSANALRVSAAAGGIEDISILAFVTTPDGFSTYDAVTAAEMMASFAPDLLIVHVGIPDSYSLFIPADGSAGNITKLCILPRGHNGTDTTPTDNIVDGSTVKLRADGLSVTCGTVALQDVTSAELLAGTNMTVLDFQDGDRIRSVNVSVGETFSGGQLLYMNVVGSSYA